MFYCLIYYLFFRVAPIKWVFVRSLLTKNKLTHNTVSTVKDYLPVSLLGLYNSIGLEVCSLVDIARSKSN